jgi:hypothetical protein
LVLVLNDRVAGTATAYYFPDANVWRFSFLVPTELMRNGCNTVSLFDVDTDENMTSVPLTETTDC